MERHHTATAYVVSKGHTLLLWHNFLQMWLPPGGHSEVNEHPVETAIREAQEELREAQSKEHESIGKAY